MLINGGDGEVLKNTCGTYYLQWTKTGWIANSSMLKRDNKDMALKFLKIGEAQASQ